MQKRIRQIARGEFKSDRPVLSISEEELLLTVTEGQEYTGEFEITSENQIPMRGVVYSTHPRMECLTPQFEGESVRIRYQFHSEGLIEGQEEKGAFVILCEQSVHSLSFCVSVSRLYAQTAKGAVRNLSDFTALARENWEEAYQLFYHKSFPNILKAKEITEKMVYKGILAAKPSQQNLEEFLVAAGRKGQIHFTLAQKDCRLSAVTETQQQTVEIKKSEWGYLELSLSVDAAFVQLENTHLTTEDFLGSSYLCRFQIDYDRMHAGNNYAKLTVSSVYETKTMEIYAHKDSSEKSVERMQRQKKKQCQSGLLEVYQDYRLKKIVTGVWTKKSVELLDKLHVLQPEDPMYLLMKAQALVINHQRQEAEWILNAFKRDWEDHHSPEWGYYLYIMTLLEREPSYVDRMTHEIELIFHENPDSPLLFWVLSFLQEEYYNNSSHKLRAIAHWVMHGCASPYFYVEAYYLICRDPYLLSKLGRFEIRILRWAIRKGVLTSELAEQIFEVIKNSREFDSRHYELLCAACKQDEKPEYVAFICSYLIRAQKFAPQFHTWYQKGIEQELRITGLYEAYLLSLDEREVALVPKIIRMYFQYESNLPYRKMAILYNNIIASKESEPEIYEQYRKVMGRFAMEQIEQAHMDDNLAVVYEDMLELGLVNEELARGLAKVLFVHKLVIMQPHMIRAIVYQMQMKEPQIVPIVEGCAYISLFSDDYVILFEDKKGRRYVGSVPYRLEELIDARPYLEKCRELAPNELPYILSYFSERPDYEAFGENEEKFFHRILFADELDPAYQAIFAMRIAQYYEKRDPEPMLGLYLEQADFAQMPQAARQYMLDMLVDWQMYGQAYDLVLLYGMDQIGPTAKVALASYLLGQMQEQENEACDEDLLRLCEGAFFSKKYNDRILQYLSNYYRGPVEQMLRLWRAARGFDLRTADLEERILEQMLFTGMDLVPAEEVFAHYYAYGGQDVLLLAVLTVWAYNYFVHGSELPQIFVDMLKKRYRLNMKLNDVCKLSLLKNLSEYPDTSDDAYVAADELLAEYTGKNMQFAFYKKLDRRLIQKYHLYDKVFVEYRTDPEKQVVLHYRRDEDDDTFYEIEMQNVYEGIFVQAFVVFFGEVVQYYITESYKNTVKTTKSNRLTCDGIYAQKDESRYNLINQMLMAEILSEDADLFAAMKQYAGLEEMTKNLFQLL